MFSFLSNRKCKYSIKIFTYHTAKHIDTGLGQHWPKSSTKRSPTRASRNSERNNLGNHPPKNLGNHPPKNLRPQEGEEVISSIKKNIKVSIWKQKYNSFSPTTKITLGKNNSYHFPLTKLFIYILLIPHRAPLLFFPPSYGYMLKLIFLYNCLILKDPNKYLGFKNFF